MMKIEEKIAQAARILNTARYVTALTGAGISAPSGVPDFRGSGSGLWERVDPFKVATIFAFRQDPQAFYDWVRPLLRLILDAQPNPAHLALAELEKMGVLKAVITQNIDGLHQRAKSQTVYQVHGHLRRATCIRCYASIVTDSLMQTFLESGAVPHCEKCSGVMKPDIILYGEQLPAQVLIAAHRVAQKSDVMIVAGSSLTVAPAGDIPLLTKKSGGKLILVNLSSTHLDHKADVVMRADVADVLPRLVQAMQQSQL